MENTSEQEIEEWLHDLKNGLASGTCKGPNFLKPYLLVTLATELSRHSEKNLTMQGKLESYAARMGLWDAINSPPPCEVFKRKEEGRFLPIQKIISKNNTENNINDISTKLAKILEPICVNTETIKGIDISLTELLENCLHHANSKIGGAHGLVCCQPWGKAKLLQIAICDGGIGIRDSLSKNPDLRDKLARQNSCEIATEYKVTGNLTGRNTGYGLCVAKSLLEQNFGNLLIISGNEFFRSYNKSISKGTLSIEWKGTILVLEFNTDKEMNCKAVYDSLPLPEGFTDDDFNL
jgi:anti-sigma regulatory factor (Ser/Thr protein kinase)